MATSKHLTLMPGDVVTVRAIVSVESPGGSEGVNLVTSGGLEVHADRGAVEVVSFGIATGDEVREITALDDFDERSWPYGIVAAVVGKTAWVRWPSGDALEPTMHLKRIRTEREVAAGTPRFNERAGDQETSSC